MLGLSPNQDAKCLALSPFRHVRADFADHLQRRETVHAVDSGQVHPGHPVQLALDIEAGRILLIALLALGSRRLAVAAVFKPLQHGFNLPVALGNPGLIPPVQLQGLGQLEDVLLPPMALQRLGDGRLVGLDPAGAQPGQPTRVPFPARDGLDDVHARLARDVSDDVPELHVHLGQRLLHVLNMMGGVLHQHGPLPHVAAQAPDVPAGTESPGKQAVGVELLEPLAVHTGGVGWRRRPFPCLVGGDPRTVGLKCNKRCLNQFGQIRLKCSICPRCIGKAHTVVAISPIYDKNYFSIGAHRGVKIFAPLLMVAARRDAGARA